MGLLRTVYTKLFLYDPLIPSMGLAASPIPPLAAGLSHSIRGSTPFHGASPLMVLHWIPAKRMLYPSANRSRMLSNATAFRAAVIPASSRLTCLKRIIWPGINCPS